MMNTAELLALKDSIPLTADHWDTPDHRGAPNAQPSFYPVDA